MQKHQTIEEMDFFALFSEVAREVWKCVGLWRSFASDTVGKQLVRAADSVGANLVEGDGRYSDADALHFFIIARASARETRYWIRLAHERSLLTESEAVDLTLKLTSATKLLNGFIRYRRENKNQNIIREENEDYDA